MMRSSRAGMYNANFVVSGAGRGSCCIPALRDVCVLNAVGDCRVFDAGGGKEVEMVAKEVFKVVIS